MDELHKRILDLEIKLLKVQENMLNNCRSFELNELFSSLAKAQAEMQPAGLTSANPFFKSKYADLAEIVKASRPALTKHGLSVIQQIMINEEGIHVLHTILAHSSGQWLETRMKIIPAKNDVQTLGSYISYIRRYSYAALVGVVVGDEDDDGEVAVAPERSKMQRITHSECIVPEQLHELEYELAGNPDIAQNIKEKLKINTLAEMKQENFINVINHIRKTKQAKEKATA